MKTLGIAAILAIAVLGSAPVATADDVCDASDMDSCMVLKPGAGSEDKSAVGPDSLWQDFAREVKRVGVGALIPQAPSGPLGGCYLEVPALGTSLTVRGEQVSRRA